MTFKLPKLKFSPEDLGEFMSAETIKFHYEKHHQAYTDKANEAIAGTKYEKMSVTDIIKESYENDIAIFNNTAQYYNHCIFWEVMDTTIDKTISREFEDKINEKFGSFEEFKTKFTELAVSQFGSGWCWLTKDKDGNLDIYKTSNAKTPILEGEKVLMTCDVWEHAYYLDYQNRRPDYIKNFLDHLVNWKIVENRFDN